MKQPGSGGEQPATSSGYSLPRGVRLTRWLVARLGSKTLLLIILASIVGAGGGVGAVVFRKLISLVNRSVYPGGNGLAQLAANHWYWMIAVPALGGALVGPLVYFFAREAKGHGVPEVMDSVANKGGRIRARVAVVKILASAISIGVGASVGREGPIVQIGSSLGSTVGQLTGLDARSLRLLVGCGAAAGIAATFNAPIAGTLFALEIIVGIGTIRTFTPLVVATVVATVISRYYLGDSPAFEVPRYGLSSVAELPLYIVLGVVAAGVAVGFSRGLYWMEDLWARLPVHEAAKPVVGGAAVGALALVFPHVMGAGYETIGAVLASDASYDVTLLLGLLVAKVLATHLSLGAGFSGGVFAPSLFIGAALGGAFGQIAQTFMPAGMVAPSGAYAVVAMGAVVAAATHAPLTVILIVFEMTGDYRVILPLMLSTLIASALSIRLSADSIYTLKLARRGARMKRTGDQLMRGTQVSSQMHAPEHVIPPGTAFPKVVERALTAGLAPIFVVDERRHLLGQILLENVSDTIRDEAVLGELLVAADIMRPVLETAAPDESLARGLQILGQGPGHLAVLDAEGRLVGVLNRTDILALYDREMLQRDAGVLAFVDTESSETPSAIQAPPGEGLTRVVIGGELSGRTLAELDLRAQHGVYVHGVTAPDEPARRPDPDQPLVAGETLLVTGPIRSIEKLRELADAPPAQDPT